MDSLQYRQSAIPLCNVCDLNNRMALAYRGGVGDCCSQNLLVSLYYYTIQKNFLFQIIYVFMLGSS